jgi:hypothetical protein
LRHGALVGVIVGTEGPVWAVAHNEPDPESDGKDSGFSILLSDAPEDPLELEPEALQAIMHTICLHCAIEEYPEVGRGLDLAKQHGFASRDPDTGEWTTEDD